MVQVSGPNALNGLINSRSLDGRFRRLSRLLVEACQENTPLAPRHVWRFCVRSSKQVPQLYRPSHFWTTISQPDRYAIRPLHRTDVQMCCVAINGDIARGSQFSLNDVEVVTAIYIEGVRAHRTKGS